MDELTKTRFFSPAFRYCPKCLKEYHYHSDLFQLYSVDQCPLHGCKLQTLNNKLFGVEMVTGYSPIQNVMNFLPSFLCKPIDMEPFDQLYNQLHKTDISRISSYAVGNMSLPRYNPKDSINISSDEIFNGSIKYDEKEVYSILSRKFHSYIQPYFKAFYKDSTLLFNVTEPDSLDDLLEESLVLELINTQCKDSDFVLVGDYDEVTLKEPYDTDNIPFERRRETAWQAAMYAYNVSALQSASDITSYRRHVHPGSALYKRRYSSYLISPAYLGTYDEYGGFTYEYSYERYICQLDIWNFYYNKFKEICLNVPDDLNDFKLDLWKYLPRVFYHIYHYKNNKIKIIRNVQNNMDFFKI